MLDGIDGIFRFPAHVTHEGFDLFIAAQPEPQRDQAFILEPRTTHPLPASPIFTIEMGEVSSEILLDPNPL